MVALKVTSKRGAVPKSLTDAWTSILAPSRSATLAVFSFKRLPCTDISPSTPLRVSLRNTSLATLALSPKTGRVLAGGGGGGTSVAGLVADGAVVTAVAASAVGAIGTAGCSAGM